MPITRGRLFVCTTLVACAVTALSANPGRADAPQPSGDAATIAVARKYLEAYQRIDVDGMAALYHPQARFVDPTSEDSPAIPQPWDYQGRDTIVAALKKIANVYQSIDYDMSRVYESSGFVVFVADTVGRMRTAEGGEQSFGSQIVTIIQVKDGKVFEHRDYFDYDGIRPVEAAR